MPVIAALGVAILVCALIVMVARRKLRNRGDQGAYRLGDDEDAKDLFSIGVPHRQQPMTKTPATRGSIIGPAALLTPTMAPDGSLSPPGRTYSPYQPDMMAPHRQNTLHNNVPSDQGLYRSPTYNNGPRGHDIGNAAQYNASQGYVQPYQSQEHDQSQAYAQQYTEQGYAEHQGYQQQEYVDPQGYYTQQQAYPQQEYADPQGYQMHPGTVEISGYAPETPGTSGTDDIPADLPQAH